MIEDSTIAQNILNHIIKFKRSIVSKKTCSESCEECFKPHLQKIITYVKKNEPILFVLPAFPGKSPNLIKVLGIFPDMGEKIALNFLQNICHQIQKIYTPGAKIIICSDGRVFNDIIGMQENNISAYRNELNLIIKNNNFNCLSIFTLEDVYKDINYAEMRHHLIEKYGESLESLKTKVKRGNQNSAPQEDIEEHNMYCGMIRFLFEDSIYPAQQKTRNTLQKEARIKAYELIRRSHAWSKLIADYFPQAVRLSVHPQMCGSQKLGIRLIGAESWMTPWHGVALKTNKGFILLKRHEAEKLGAKLVVDSTGRESHFTLASDSHDINENEVFK